MIIAIPLDEGKESVCVSFGRAPFFLFADTDSGKMEIKENIAANEQGGAGIKAAQFIVDEGAKALITVRCGENSADVLKEAEITIYKSKEVYAKANVELYMRGELEQLTKFHAGFHGAV